MRETKGAAPGVRGAAIENVEPNLKPPWQRLPGDDAKVGALGERRDASHWPPSLLEAALSRMARRSLPVRAASLVYATSRLRE